MVTKMGFLNRFRRGQPARTNSSKLNAALRAYAASIRTLRNAPSASRNSVIAAAKSNSNAVNGAIVNYVMNFNKAKYAAAKAANVVPAAVEGLVPANAATNAALQAARANNNLAAAQAKVAAEVKQANKYRGLSTNNLARAANNFAGLNAAAKNNFRRALNEKMAALNKGSPQYDLLENVKARIGGRTAAAFVGAVNNNNTSRQAAQKPSTNNSKINSAIANKNFSQLNTINLISAAANKVAASNSAVKNAYVNFVTRQIGQYNSDNNKRKLKAARNLVKPPAGVASGSNLESANVNTSILGN